MDEPENREKVFNELENELKRDRAKTKLLKISEFGLIELTRKRTKRSLDRMLSMSCPYCEGSGRVKSAETMSFEIMRQLKKSADALEGDSIVIRAHPEVAAYLDGALQTFLFPEMTNRNRKVIVRADSSMHYEQFDIAII
jgi:ribonuclease G